MFALIHEKYYTVNARISVRVRLFKFLSREGGANLQGGAYLKGVAYFVF